METKRIVGIIGAGAMGSGIAQVCAQAGHVVYLFDVNQSVVIGALTKMAHGFDKLIEKGKFTRDQVAHILGNIKASGSLSDMKDCDFVIEAVVENLKIKQQIFKDLEGIVRKDCILASNTSSLSVTSIAAACHYADRVLGIHFFNPAPVMQLVEIIPAIQTNPNVTITATQFISSCGKLTVQAKDTPGFIVNRIARPFYGEAIRIMEEGIADMSTIDWAMTTLGGFRMGPFALMDFIGHDVNYTVTETVFAAFFFDPRYKPSFSQKRLVEAGWLGKKTGRGFYQYAADAPKLEPNTDQKLGEIIVHRIIAMLINEAADALHLGIATVADIETAMTKGVNYPRGLLSWADDLGIDNIVKKLDTLYDEYHEDRYRVSPILRRMARNGQLFVQS